MSVPLKSPRTFTPVPPKSSAPPSPITSVMAPKVAIVYYSMYGHIAKLASAEKAGIEAAGGSVDVYQ